MADFTHLKGLSVKEDATSNFVFYGISGEPTLLVRPATNANIPFFNAVLKQSKAAMRRSRGRKGQLPTAETIEAARQEDITLFARFIVIGWERVVDASGAAVPFSEEVCRQFLNAIPLDMFNDLRAYCLDINNFRDTVDEMEPEELEELQGN